MTRQPLAEVFGFPIDNMSPEAKRHRKHRLCPFGNKVPNCTKDKANNPLGVCSVLVGDEAVVTCPVRFRQAWIIAEDAASFFFRPGTKWTTLGEIRLEDRNRKVAGNVDVVVVSYDEHGKITDFGALEVQAVYVSGNVRNPFEHYIKAPSSNRSMDWDGRPNYPRPDYLSSSRKRLAPELMFKGGILKAWGKKIAVALDRGFYETLPALEEVAKAKADIAWMIYDLKREASANSYVLTRHKTVYTEFGASLDRITTSSPGDLSDFVSRLQDKVDEKLEGNPPDTRSIDELL